MLDPTHDGCTSKRHCLAAGLASRFSLHHMLQHVSKTHHMNSLKQGAQRT